jgi:hypothetical protein
MVDIPNLSKLYLLSGNPQLMTLANDFLATYHFCNESTARVMTPSVDLNILNCTNVNYYDTVQSTNQILWTHMSVNDTKVLYDGVGYMMNFFTIKSSSVIMESALYMPQNFCQEPNTEIQQGLKSRAPMGETNKSAEKMRTRISMHGVDLTEDCQPEEPKDTTVFLSDLTGVYHRSTRRIFLDPTKLLNLNKFCTWNDIKKAINNDALCETYWDELTTLTLGKAYCTLAVTFYENFPLPGITFKEIYHLLRDPLRVRVMV